MFRRKLNRIRIKLVGAGNGRHTLDRVIRESLFGKVILKMKPE